MKQEIICSLCGRTTPTIYAERHHDIPRSKGGKESSMVCNPCGDQIHLLFTNKELRDTYKSIEKLRENERVQKWIKFIRKHNDFHVCMKIKKRR
jgi:5-methylcytosine-specific restriction endonuclease McrA